MAADFSGKWTLQKTDNLDDFLEAQGVGWMQRKAAAMANVTHEITQDGNKFTLNIVNPRKTKNETFVADGTSFDSVEERNGEEIPVKVTPKFENGVLTTVVSSPKLNITTVRSLENGQMILRVTDTDKKVTMVRYFSK